MVHGLDSRLLLNESSIYQWRDKTHNQFVQDVQTFFSSLSQSLPPIQSIHISTIPFVIVGVPTCCLLLEIVVIASSKEGDHEFIVELMKRSSQMFYNFEVACSQSAPIEPETVVKFFNQSNHCTCLLIHISIHFLIYHTAIGVRADNAVASTLRSANGILGEWKQLELKKLCEATKCVLHPTKKRKTPSSDVSTITLSTRPYPLLERCGWTPAMKDQFQLEKVAINSLYYLSTPKG